MPDRFEVERRVSDAIQVSVASYSGSWKDVRSQMARAIQPTLEEYMAIVILLLMGNEELLATSIASRGSRWIASEIADLVVDRVRAEPIPPGGTPSIDPGRADGIAVTEVTRATTEAETEAREALGKRDRAKRREEEPTDQPPREPTGPLDVVDNQDVMWQTFEDERVCPICEPLNQQLYERWASEFPNGPPAHPRCRCFLVYPPRQNS